MTIEKEIRKSFMDSVNAFLDTHDEIMHFEKEREDFRKYKMLKKRYETPGGKVKRKYMYLFNH